MNRTIFIIHVGGIPRMRETSPFSQFSTDSTKRSSCHPDKIARVICVPCFDF